MNEHKFYRQNYSIKDYSSQWFPWDSVKMVRFGGHFILIPNMFEFRDPLDRYIFQTLAVNFGLGVVRETHLQSFHSDFLAFMSSIIFKISYLFCLV